MVVKRLAVPQLGSPSIQTSPAGVLRRSFRFGVKDFIRHFRDEPLELDVDLAAPPGVKPLVVLHTDVGAPDASSWCDIPFTHGNGQHFHLSLTVPRCGLYRFRVKYSLDGGQQWNWDRVPHSYVLVDPPALRTVRLYTLIPSASGCIRDWMARLAEIKAMGFDTVHLLPITTMGASESPYSAADLFAVDPRFLNPGDRRDGLEQFEAFVDECCRLGIRLCLDLVLNHVAADGIILQNRPDWIVADDSEPDGHKRAGCWHMQAWIRWTDLALVHYDHPDGTVRREIWDYMGQYAAFWSHYAAATGGMVRFDNLHSSHTGFIAELSRSLRDKYPDLTILGEYFTDELTLEKTVPEWGINLLLANSWEHPFGPQLRHYIQYIHTVSGRLRYVCSITTHDTGVPAQLFGAAKSAIPRYMINALYGTGQAGMVQGVEAAVRERIVFIGPARKLTLTAVPEIRDNVTRINQILQQYRVFQQHGNITFIDGGHAAILAAYRYPVRPEDGSAFLLFANLDTESVQRISISLDSIGLTLPLPLVDMISGDAMTVRQDHLEVAVDPCNIKIYMCLGGWL